MSDGLTIVLSGPGGVGKGTIAEILVAADDDLWLSRSWTTRDRRPGEDADAYVFASREEFIAHRDDGGFLEWAEFLGNFYGTPVPDAVDGRDLLLEIDVQGALQVREQNAEAIVFFVVAPSLDVQAARLRGRGDPEEAVQQRLEEGRMEARLAETLDATVVVNDDLDRCVAELQELIGIARTAR